MREATVYTLAKSVQGYRGGFVEMHSAWLGMGPGTPAPLTVYDASDPEAFVAMSETIERLPVYCLKNPHTGEELLVAMDQRIHVILTAAAESKYRDDLSRAYGERSGYRMRINDFCKAPWYRRVWRALRKEL